MEKIKKGMTRNALLIVDVQNCFINKKTAKLPLKIATHIKNSQYSFIIFTQFINQKNSQFVTRLNWQECFTSPSIDIDERLKEFIKDNVFQKSSYSAFKSEELLKFLKTKHIETIDICGLDADACILATAFDGFDLGLDIHILTKLIDCSNSNTLYEATLEIIKRNIQK